MIIVISGMMGAGTLESKVMPLSRLNEVDKIIFVRKEEGPPLAKTEYVILPKVCSISIFNLLLTPFILFWVVKKNNASLLISYHIIPYAYFVSFVGTFSRTPYVVAQTGLQIQEQFNNRIINRNLWFIFKRALSINIPGRSSIKFWQNNFPTIAGKFNILHSTVDTDHFRPKERLVNENKSFDFIYLGRLHKIKNIDLIVKSFARLRDLQNREARMLIVGDGPERVYLEKLVKNLKLEKQVFFSGFVKDPAPYIQKSKFLVMASTSEGLPTAMMQCMACEVIPITNLVGNISDIVENKSTGFTFDNLRIEEISEVMKNALLMDPNELGIIRKKCRNIITENHSYNVARLKWLNLFKNNKLT